jgi:deoxyribose-phosphate aldolase
MYDQQMFECTCLSPFLWYGNDVVEKEIIDGFRHRVRAIVVEPHQVSLLKELEAGYGNGFTRTGMSIGYPYGGLTTRTKVELVKYAVENQIQEVNIGIDITAVVSDDFDRARRELEAILSAAENKTTIVPVSWVIQLPLEMIDRLCAMYIELGITQMKTSAGLHHGELKVEHVDYLYRHFGDKLELELNGRIRSREKAEKMKAAGGASFHISSWRRICSGENDYQWDLKSKTFGYTKYIDRL